MTAQLADGRLRPGRARYVPGVCAWCRGRCPHEEPLAAVLVEPGRPAHVALTVPAYGCPDVGGIVAVLDGMGVGFQSTTDGPAIYLLDGAGGEVPAIMSVYLAHTVLDGDGQPAGAWRIPLDPDRPDDSPALILTAAWLATLPGWLADP